MAARCLALALLPAAGISGAWANTVECGGNSFSYAEVRQAPPGQVRRGPIVVVPDSLCADLIEHRRRPPPNLDIVIDPRSGPPFPVDPSQQPVWK